MRISKKILAITLSILMSVSMMPFTAFAATTIDVATAADLKTAVANADSGDTIRFTASFAHTAKQVGFQVDKDLTFDLNGQTITGPANGTTKTTDGDTLNKTEVMWVTGSANVTFKDSVGGGSWTYTYSANSAAYFVDARDNSVITVESGTYTSSNANYGGYVFYLRNNASLVVNGGTIEATGSSRRDSCVFSNTSTTSVEVNGGTFNTGKNSDYTVSNSGITEINDGTFNGTVSGTAGKTVINGGEFKKADGTTTQDVSKYTATDKVQNENGVVVDVQASTVAKIGNTEYSSLEAAITAAAAGDTIVLVKDTTLSTTDININKNLTINFGENTVTAARWPFINNATLTLNGTTGGIASSRGVVDNYGTLNVNGGVYSNTQIGTPVFWNNPGATMVIKGGTVNAISGVVQNEGNLQIKGGVLNSESSSISHPGKYTYAINCRPGSSATMTGGTINAVHGGIVAVGEDGADTTTVVINNGTITTHNSEAGNDAYYPIYVSGNGSSVTVNGGTFSGPRAAAMLDDDDVGLTENASLTITGGTFTSPSGIETVTRGQNDSAPVISGGIFSSDVSDYAIDGYEAVYDETAGGYVIAEDNHTVAKIGNAKYDSLQAAIDAASSNDTITLVADVDLATDETINIYSKGNITIDLNGHDITGDVHTSYSSNYIGMVNIANSTVVIGDSSANPGTIANESTGYYATAAIVVGAAKTSAVSGITGASSLTINDGVNVVCNNVYGQTVDGRMRKNLCNGIAVRAQNGAATLVVNDANITTNGVGINCQSASAQNPVSVTVNDGSITCTNTGSANACCLQTSVYDAEEYVMTVNGGDFSAQAESALGTNYKYEDSINGGSFSSDVDAYTSEGFAAVYDETAGKYVVKAVQYGTATATGATIQGANTSETTIILPITTLNWVEANPSVGRSVDGWWTPEFRIVSNNSYESIADLADAKYINDGNGVVKSFYNNRDSGSAIPMYLRCWAYVDAEMIQAAKDAGEEYVEICYKDLDWDGDGYYEQHYSVKALADNIVLMKDGEQVYPEVFPAEPDNGSSLTLSDKIETTIYIDAEAYGVDPSTAVVKATYNHNAADTTPAVSTDTIALSDLDQYEGQTAQYVGTYMFKYACAPAQLTEDCTIELYEDANAASPVYTETYSAKTYCDKVNEAYAEAVNPDAALTKLNTLCNALVDYAKASQFQFNYGKDLTDAYRDARVQTLAAGDMEATANVKTDDVAGFAFDCQDELNILVYTNSEVAPTGVSMNATKYTDKISAAAQVLGGTQNVIRVKGLGSGNINKVVTVETANGNITVSANAIAKAYVGADSVPSTMKELARAIYLYGAAAADYFGA